MLDFSDFKELEHTRRRKLANNTHLIIRNDGGYGIKLHDTEVIVHYPSSIVLNSGGWQTVTTKARMNEFSTAHVYSDGGVWMVDWYGKEFPFADGMELYYGGTVTGAGNDPNATKKLRKRVNQFAKDYADAFTNGMVPAPSGGDCWLCMMPQPNCLESHMEESYFVPRMLYNAMQADLGTLSLFAKDYIARTWSPDHETPTGSMTGIAHDQIRKTIRKYCFHQLGLAT